MSTSGYGSYIAAPILSILSNFGVVAFVFYASKINQPIKWTAPLKFSCGVVAWKILYQLICIIGVEMQIIQLPITAVAMGLVLVFGCSVTDWLLLKQFRTVHKGILTPLRLEIIRWALTAIFVICLVPYIVFNILSSLGMATPKFSAISTIATILWGVVATLYEVGANAYLGHGFATFAAQRQELTHSSQDLVKDFRFLSRLAYVRNAINCITVLLYGVAAVGNGGGGLFAVTAALLGLGSSLAAVNLMLLNKAIIKVVQANRGNSSGVIAGTQKLTTVGNAGPTSKKSLA